jgi:hypothetical protein
MAPPPLPEGAVEAIIIGKGNDESLIKLYFKCL